jgi:hypothetical protein
LTFILRGLKLKIKLKFILSCLIENLLEALRGIYLFTGLPLLLLSAEIKIAKIFEPRVEQPDAINH